MVFLVTNILVYSGIYPCMSFFIGLVTLIYVDYSLFFRANMKYTYKFVQEVKGNKLSLNIGYNMYELLGVEVSIDSKTKRVKLEKTVLINKVPKITGHEESNNKTAPYITTTIGTYSKGQPMKGRGYYTSVFGMLLYLPIKSSLSIQVVFFVVNPSHTVLNK